MTDSAVEAQISSAQPEERDTEVETITYQAKMRVIATGATNGGGSLPLANDTLTPGVPHKRTAPVAIPLPAIDPGGRALKYEIVHNPEYGSVILKGAVGYYTPCGDNVAGDSFRFRVNNGKADSNSASVWIQLTNTAPKASNGLAMLCEGIDSYCEIELMATDPDEDYLTYHIVDAPRHGTVTMIGSIAYYRPLSTFDRVDSFTFRAHDGRAESNIASIRVVRQKLTRIFTPDLVAVGDDAGVMQQETAS